MTKVMITGFQASTVASGKITCITIERRLGLARIFQSPADVISKLISRSNI